MPRPSCIKLQVLIATSSHVVNRFPPGLFQIGMSVYPLIAPIDADNPPIMVDDLRQVVLFASIRGHSRAINRHGRASPGSASVFGVGKERTGVFLVEGHMLSGAIPCRDHHAGNCQVLMATSSQGVNRFSPGLSRIGITTGKLPGQPLEIAPLPPAICRGRIVGGKDSARGQVPLICGQTAKQAQVPLIWLARGRRREVCAGGGSGRGQMDRRTGTETAPRARGQVPSNTN